jgi:hypothetical protein
MKTSLLFNKIPPVLTKIVKPRLSDKEWENFVKEINRSDRAKPFLDGDIKLPLDSRFYWYIDVLLLWRNTEQGQEYWEEISNREE